MRSKLLSALCLAAALSIGSAAALAQDDRFVNDVDAKQRAACTPDVQRLCNQYIPDVQQIVTCLKAQRASLSAACADVFSVPEDCKPDVQALCAYAQLPGLLMTGLMAASVAMKKDISDFNVQNPLMFNPGAFMDQTTAPKFIYSLASSLDLFSFWIIFLIATGIKAAAGKKISFGGALFAVILPWAVFVLGRAALSGLGS